MEQLSLLEQGREESPDATDAEVVALVAGRIIDELQLAPPIDPEIVASYQGVIEIQVRNSLWAACLLEDHGQLVIQVSADDGLRRRRFSVFHEIGHTFQPGFRLQPVYRCHPGVLEQQRQEEYLCDVAASELLLPRRYFSRDLIGTPFDMNAVADIAERYEASLEATARRFVDFWPEEAMMVVLEVGTKPADRFAEDPEPRLRVKYGHTKGSWPYVPKYKSAADSSLLYSVLAKESVRGESDLDGLVRESASGVELTALSCPFVDGSGHLRERVIAVYRKPRRIVSPSSRRL